MGSIFKSLFLKLKERKVFRTLIIYLGGAWVAMQVISLFIDRYELTGFVFDMLMILIIAGIPGSVIIAWFHGEVGAQKVTRLEIILHSILLSFAIIAGIITYNTRHGNDHYMPDHDENTIAVLPFENMSGSEDDEYFSDGITDDIITNLSKIDDIQVISRFSVMAYKNTDLSLNEIAEKLNVNVILEGSVRKIQNKVRISAKLINVASQENIWAETYDREITEVFAVQSEVARSIAENLQVKLTPKIKRRLDITPTANLDAYDLYLKGREYYYLLRDHDNEIAVDLFKKALKFDPDYAMAHAGLADAYAQRAVRYHHPDAWLDSAIVEGKKAVSLDPEAAEGYKALAVGYAYKGFTDLAIEFNESALERNPNFFPAINNLGVMYGRIGELDKQLPLLEKAIALAPLSTIPYLQLGEVYAELGFDEKAMEYIDEAMQMQPDLTESYYSLGRILTARGLLADALEVTNKGLDISPDDPGLMANMGRIKLFMGDYDEAEHYLEKVYDLNLGVSSLMDPIGLEPGYLGFVYLKGNKPEVAKAIFRQVENTIEESINEGNSYYKCFLELGRVYAIQGKNKEALEWLRQAFDNGWHEYRFAIRDPTLDPLRDEPEFKGIMDKMRRKLKTMSERITRKSAG